MSKMVAIPLKGKNSLDVDLNEVLEKFEGHVLEAILIKGLQALLGAKMQKIAVELGSDIIAKAKANLEDLRAGKVGRASAKAKGVSGAVMTEAKRIARLMVRDEIRRTGGKISHYTAAEITAAAVVLINDNPEIVTKAEQNLAERSAGTIKVDVSALKVDPILVAKAEDKKKKKSEASTISAGQLSAAKAAKSKPTVVHTH